MFCGECGTQVPGPDVRFCANCGHPLTVEPVHARFPPLVADASGYGRANSGGRPRGAVIAWVQAHKLVSAIAAAVLVAGVTVVAAGGITSSHSAAYQDGYSNGQQLSSSVNSGGGSAQSVCQASFDVGKAQNPGENESDYISGCVDGVNHG